MSRTNPSIFTSIEPVLLEWSNETSWVFPAFKPTSYFFSHSTVSRRSRFKFRSQFKLWPQIRCLITLRIESSIISIDSNITDNIIRSLVYSRKNVDTIYDQPKATASWNVVHHHFLLLMQVCGMQQFFITYFIFIFLFDR